MSVSKKGKHLPFGKKFSRTGIRVYTHSDPASFVSNFAAVTSVYSTKAENSSMGNLTFSILAR